METTKPVDDDIQLARSLAAEDVRVGDMVAILDTLGEYPSFLWDRDAELLPPHEPVRVRWLGQKAGKPLKVKAICLPYILAKAPSGRYRTIDVRRCRLARLSPRYARMAWKQCRKACKKKQKKQA